MKRHKPTGLKPPPKMPAWVLAIVIVSVIPVLGWPFWMARFDFQQDGQTTFLAIVFPIYIVACGYLAYKCYLIRKEVTFILLAIVWLSYCAAFFL